MSIYSKYAETGTVTLLGKTTPPSNVTFNTPVIHPGTGGITLTWNKLNVVAAACSNNSFSTQYACEGAGTCSVSTYNNDKDACEEAGSCSVGTITNKDACEWAGTCSIGTITNKAECESPNNGGTWTSTNTWTSTRTWTSAGHTWTEANNSDLDFKEYVIQRAPYDSTTWETTLSNNTEVYRGNALEFLFTTTNTDWNTIADSEQGGGSGVTFLIKAVDTSDNYSTTAALTAFAVSSNDVGRVVSQVRIYRQPSSQTPTGMSEGDIWFVTDSSPINRQYIYTGSAWESAEGSSARAVSLSSPTQAITYDSDGATPSPSAAFTITATAQNTSGTVYYGFYKDGSGTAVQNTTSNTYSYTPDSSFSNLPDTFEVKLREGTNSSTVLSTDTFSVFGVKPGAVGSPGDDAHTGFLTNAVHVVPTASDGTGYSYTGSGGTFTMYDGTTDVTGSATTYAVGTSGTAVTETTNGLTLTITQSTGVYALTGASWTSDSEEFTIRGTHGGVTVTQVYSLSKAKAGVSANDGRAVSLSSPTQAITYDSDGATPSPSAAFTITATAQNTSGTVYYGFYKDGSGTAVQNTTSNTYSYTPDSSFSNLPDTFEVKLREGTNSSTVLSTDTFSVFGVKPGAVGSPGDDAHTGFLTNAVHVVPTASDGTGYSYTGSGGTFTMYDGTTDVTGSATTYAVGTSGTAVTETTNGLTLTITQSTGVYALTGASWTSDSEEFTIRGTHGGVTVTQVYSLSKAKAGVSANDGRAVSLSSPTQAITYDSDGATPSPSAAFTITATAQNTSGTVYYGFYKDGSGTAVQNTTSNTYSYTPDSSFSNLPDTFEVKLREGTNSSTVLSTDTFSVFGVKPGAVGSPGDDAHTGFLTNAVHVVPTASDGTGYSYTGSGGTFTMYDGTTDVTGSATTYAVGTSGTAVTETTNGLTLTITQSTGVYALTGASWTSDSEEFTIRGTHGGVTVTQVYSLSKAKAGVIGAGTNFVFARQTAKPSTPTADGLNIPSSWYEAPPTTPLETLWSSKGTVAAGGTAYVWGTVFQVEGTAVSEIKIYSDVQTSNGASPAKPTTSQSFFNITTSALTIGNTDWNATPPSVSSNGDTVYSCTALVSGSPSDTSVAVTWSTPTIYARKTDGAPGATGLAAYNVNLSANKYAIAYAIDGTESDSLTFTADPQGIQVSATYLFAVDGVTKQVASSTATYAMLDGDEPASGAAKVVKVTMYDNGVEKATDSVSVYGIQDGEDAITVVMTNEAHALPTTSGGVVTYTNSGTDIRVWRGSTALAYHADDDSTFSIGTPDDTNITVGAATTASTYSRRYAVASSITAATASISFPITVRNSVGTLTMFTKLQTLNKTTDGTHGISTYLYTVYRRSSTVLGTNDKPTNGSYTFGTGGTAPTTPATWYNDIPTYNGTPLYASSSTATLSTGGTGAATLTSWSSPVLIAQESIQIYRQDAIPGPTGVYAGDLWVDTNDNNKFYIARADSSDDIAAGEWESAEGLAHVAKLLLDDIAADNIVTPVEKLLAKTLWEAIEAEKTDIINAALEHGVSSDTFSSAYTALDTYLNTTETVFSDMTAATTLTASGGGVTVGTPSTFNPALTRGTSVAFDPNTPGKFVIVYEDDANSDYGTAIVGTVSGNTITYGSEYDFDTGDVSIENINVAFDPNTAGKFVVVWDDNANNKGKAVVGTISGTVISFGSVYQFNSSYCHSITIAFDPNASDKFIIAYTDQGTGDSEGTAIVGTISGTVISFGSEYIFHLYSTDSTSARDISLSFDPNTPGKFVVTYQEYNSPSVGAHGAAKVGTISGTILSFGSKYRFVTSPSGSGSGGWVSDTSVDFDPNTAGKFVIAYCEGYTGGDAKAVVGNISGTDILYGDIYTFGLTTSGETVSNTDIYFDSNFSNSFVISYKKNAYARIATGSILGTTLSFVDYNTSIQATFSAVALDPTTPNRFIMSYKDYYTTYGKAVLGTNTLLYSREIWDDNWASYYTAKTKLLNSIVPTGDLASKDTVQAVDIDIDGELTISDISASIKWGKGNSDDYSAHGVFLGNQNYSNAMGDQGVFLAGGPDAWIRIDDGGVEIVGAELFNHTETATAPVNVDTMVTYGGNSTTSDLVYHLFLINSYEAFSWEIAGAGKGGGGAQHGFLSCSTWNTGGSGNTSKIEIIAGVGGSVVSTVGSAAGASYGESINSGSFTGASFNPAGASDFMTGTGGYGNSGTGGTGTGIAAGGGAGQHGDCDAFGGTAGSYLSTKTTALAGSHAVSGNITVDSTTGFTVGTVATPQYLTIGGVCTLESGGAPFSTLKADCLDPSVNGSAGTWTNETVSYTGISSNTFTGCTRGYGTSTAYTHSDNAVVKLAYIIDDTSNVIKITLGRGGAGATEGVDGGRGAGGGCTITFHG